MYEPIHGSAPSLAGTDTANPAGTILSAALMLEWSFGRPDLAKAVRWAVTETMEAGVLTADLAADGVEPARTREFAEAVAANLEGKGGIRGHRDLRHHVA